MFLKLIPPAVNIEISPRLQNNIFPQNIPFLILIFFLLILQLLDCFSIPTVLILSWLLLRARYRLSHIGGLALALMSVVTIVWVDVEDGRGGVTTGGGWDRHWISGPRLKFSKSYHRECLRFMVSFKINEIKFM